MDEKLKKLRRLGGEEFGSVGGRRNLEEECARNWKMAKEWRTMRNNKGEGKIEEIKREKMKARKN